MLPLSAHTPYPHISLGLNVNMNEKTWGGFCDSLFPASDFNWFGFIFPCWSERGTKWITQGKLTQEMRQWWVRAKDETDSGTEQSFTEEWKSACDKGLCISELFPQSLTVIPPVQICKCMSHTQRSGRVYNQDWVLVKDEVIPSTSTRAASAMFLVFSLNKSHIWSEVNARIGVSVASHMRTMHHTHAAPTALWHRKQTSHSISFLVAWCMSIAIYWYLTGQLPPTAVD